MSKNTMSFLKLCFIFYITVIEYTKACMIYFNENHELKHCILNCTDVIDSSGLYLVYDQYGYNSRKCRTQIHGENKLYISALNYHIHSISSGPIPLTRGYYTQNILDATISLNLSDNELSDTPVIKSMENLKLINLSRNNLTTAILSNNNKLRMLTEINFSYNMITDIQVNSFQHIYNQLTKINLAHNHLVNLPDAIFSEFRDLQILDLSFNYIEKLSAVTFEGARKLSQLDISNNKITCINASLFRFSELHFLNLSGNQIKYLNSDDFIQLSMLRTLDLSSNILKIVHVDVFEKNIMLETLDLNNNLLQVIEPDAFSSLQSLSSIDLSRNELKSLPTDLFKNTNIFHFSITENIFEGSLTKGMFDGINVTKLDFSYQYLSEIKDHAFQNLDNLNELFLNSNNITFLSSKCFKSLVNLKLLDLSYNQIKSIDFDTKDLNNLLSLRLKNNLITEMQSEKLAPLSSLEFLDISDNKISHLSSNLFQSLPKLKKIEIYNNPFEGTIETDTFKGLVLLPRLDMSHSMLTAIKNASFTDMRNLKEFNATHCYINELQYNVFIYTGNIKILDLSYNKLTAFFVNTTELGALSILFLNNNLLNTISSDSLSGMSGLKEFYLSYNYLENWPSEFSLINLQQLDLSYNEKLNVTVPMLKKLNSLHTFTLSGVRTFISFKYILNDSKINEIIISNASISNIKLLCLNRMVNLASLILSFNNVSKLQVGDFNGLSSLNSLDLTFNKISFIQPGVFKENEFLDVLNISHNRISSVNYGIFRGLKSLKILDMSFNKIKDLQSERFYEVNHLSELIVDFNQIESINSEDFAGTSLSKLSIGNNPIDCQVLVKLGSMKLSFEITAIRLDEHSYENVNGIICNKVHTTEPTFLPVYTSDNSGILESLLTILENLNKKNIEQEAKDNKYLEKISNSLENLSQVLIINNNTNIMLSKLIKSLDHTTAAPVFTTPVTSVTADAHGTTYIPTKKNISNVTETIDIISYVSQIKKELENTIAFEKQNIIDRIESKSLSNGDNKSEILYSNIDHSKLVSSNNKIPSFLFTETYIALILSVTLVCTFVGLLLFRLYKSRFRGDFSMRSHVLPGGIDNSTL